MKLADAATLQALGEEVGRRLFPGAVILVDGPLGAGKTTFAQGVGRGFGVTGAIVSPTYALVHEHVGRRGLFCHADVYRMESAEELVSAGLDERVGVDGAWLVEWASRFPDAWPPGRLEVRIEIDGDARAVHFVATDDAHRALIQSPPPNTT